MKALPMHTPYRRATAARFVVLALAPAALLALAPAAARAQSPDVRIIRTPPGGMATVYTRSADRAVLGVVMAPGSRADTAGIRLEEVDANSPAAKAGLKAGDVLTQINGISLRVAKEDAEDLALTGLAQRRLQRALAQVKAGDEVTLSVRSGSAAPRTVAVKTVSQAELERGEVRRMSDAGDVRFRSRSERGEGERSGDRGMVGVSVGASGSKRDTLGLFLSSVVGGGPAEQAGIVEGERIAAVNGVDVRVPREDLEDAQAVSARIGRFVREVEKTAPGATVTLKVYGNGRYRDVAVKAAKASELPRTGFSMSIGDGMGMPRMLELGREGPVGRIQLDGRELRIDSERLRDVMEHMRQQIQDGVRDGVRSFEWRALPTPPAAPTVRGRRASLVIL